MKQDDERLIREVIARWHKASAAGDVTEVLNLMAEDVVFLAPGQPPMRGRAAFSAIFQKVLTLFRIESSAEIHEIEIAGDWAYMWSHVRVTMIPLQGGTSMRRAGYTLTILRKQQDGAWVIARDANMLSLEPVDDK